MNKKIWIRTGIGFAMVLFMVTIAAGFYFYHLAIERNVKDFLAGNEDLEVSAEAMDVLLEGGWREWTSEQDFEHMELQTHDGLNLKGYYLEADEPTDKTVIFAHGYLGRGTDMGLYGQYYHEELGYNIFTADMRGHGQSEGDYIGFGWHDRLDYLAWIDQVIEKAGENTDIVLHGVSMGAATMLMTSGEDMPDNVKAVVADSPYTTVYDLFDYQLERMFHLPDVPILPSTGMVTKMRAGYTLKEASALEQVEKAEVPILYIHGKDDTFVPTEMAEELHANTNSESELVLFEDSSHGEAFVIHQERYVDKLNEFLNEYVH
ncbi:alpha/beta hydrolase [Virgibacillus xinjiangensis]|uniref:Alpha/beta hydrolase n=1 Tax=Virgibacillus xinjiangensis TaxID=393090 RepID=A0ABV7CR20_9BACI